MIILYIKNTPIVLVDDCEEFSPAKQQLEVVGKEILALGVVYSMNESINHVKSKSIQGS